MLNRRLLFKTKPAAVAPKETITHHFLFLELLRRKLSMPKFAYENVVKTETCANIRKWIACHYFSNDTPAEARVYCSQYCIELPIDMGTLSALPYCHTSVPSSCFQQYASVVNNPVKRCLPVGEAALSTPEAVVASRTD